MTTVNRSSTTTVFTVITRPDASNETFLFLYQFVVLHLCHVTEPLSTCVVIAFFPWILSRWRLQKGVFIVFDNNSIQSPKLIDNKNSRNINDFGRHTTDRICCYPRICGLGSRIWIVVKYDKIGHRHQSNSDSGHLLLVVNRWWYWRQEAQTGKFLERCVNHRSRSMFENDNYSN